ncbi:hypothetical protein QWY14_16765 [Planococcus sp. N028]|uniref:Tyr recombinase domain-containing protein n=2 Tax=Planococcus shixiaomingii TaxID=3058393 RepID=A0ABT8N6D8_9BACL|nr:hypothetical protein [Planococcus sp. N028]
MIRKLKKIEYELKNIDIQLTPHVFCHAFAITSQLSGADLFDIVRSLSHRKMKTTMIYLKKFFARKQHVMN